VVELDVGGIAHRAGVTRGSTLLRINDVAIAENPAAIGAGLELLQARLVFRKKVPCCPMSLASP
jgi:hypothetical protein